MRLYFRKTARRCLLALQARETSSQEIERLNCDTEIILRLVLVRLAFNASPDLGIGSFYTRSPLQIANSLFECLAPCSATSDILLLVIRHCIDLLEEPATTGVTFFVRSRTSCWGLESLILAFESNLLLCKWMMQFNSIYVASQGMPVPPSVCLTKDSKTWTEESDLVRRVLTLLPSAWSSVDGADDLPPNLNPNDLSLVLVRFWANVLRAPENKPFAIFLGHTLSEYAKVMENAAPLR